MNKICTDLEQSKKLLELGIDVYTADMFWKNGVSDKYIQCFTPFVSSGTDIDYDYDVPAWSLTALLYILDFPSLIQNKEDEWEVCVPNYESDEYIEVSAVNPIDACYEMIIKLKENGKI